jgi:pantoate--beta-alanine ligase
VTKLFNITEPDRAYFGQKDYQQQLLIRQMVADLDQPVDIVTCPIIREPDGLAMSSRNRYLAPDDRLAARELFRALQLAVLLAAESDLSSPEIAARMAAQLQAAGGIDLQYAVIADCRTLEILQDRPESAVALIAAKVGTTRLIDNQILQFR